MMFLKMFLKNIENKEKLKTKEDKENLLKHKRDI